METPEQAQFFLKLTEGAERLAALTEKAKTLNCNLLVRGLLSIAGAVGDLVRVQKRALNGDSVANVDDDLPFIVMR